VFASALWRRSRGNGSRSCAGRAQNLRQCRAILGCGFLGEHKGTFLPASCHYREQAYTHHAYNRFENRHPIILLAMTDAEYFSHAEALLQAVEANCDRINDVLDVDIDNQRVGGMITLTFSNRSQIIINLQKPLQEVWLATKAGGFHYKFAGTWLSTRDNTEFFADLSRHASDQSGQALIFNS
jgi:CyaY protein